ncbi:3'-5' exonuclease [Enterobacter ludwigii]|uniref:3'-5' exonuclease n=1 Tax=Enterobacter ludwigii TaxID=299767 RepID=UPI001866A7E8|nr:3'-5' exonuclease [Enterobacter ludwigii]
MPHTLIYIEALDTKPRGAITAIAAVTFDPETQTLGKRFCKRVDPESSVSRGGTISAALFKWWLRQSPESRSQLLDASGSISEALNELQCFIVRHSLYEPNGNTILWSRQSGDFCPISTLTAAFLNCNITPVWHHSDVRNTWSLEMMAHDTGMDFLATKFEGAAHDPLAHATYQARLIMNAWNHITEPHKRDSQL